MRDERRGAEGEAYPPGEGAPGEPEPSPDDERFPAGVETDEGQRPGDTFEERQPGMVEDPPRAD